MCQSLVIDAKAEKPTCAKCLPVVIAARTMIVRMQNCYWIMIFYNSVHWVVH